MDNPELREKIAHFDDIFRALPDAVVMNTAQRRIVYINQAANTMFGYTPEELIGELPQVLYAYEEDFQRLGRIYREFDVNPNLPTIPVKLRHKNGRVFDAEITGAAIRSSHNEQVIGFLSIIRDISERNAMQNALRAQEAQLRQIIDLVPQAIFVKNREGRFLLVNKAQAALYGTTVDQLTGSLIHEHHFPPAEIERFLADDRAVLDSGQPRVTDQEIVHDANGKAHIMQMTKIPYTVTGAEEPAVLGVGTDLTHQKQSETLLRQANALLETSRNALTNLIAQLPIGIQIFNQYGVCTDVNPAFLEMFAIEKADDLINCYNILEDDLADRYGTRAAAEQALTGEIVRLGDITFDFSAAEGHYSRATGIKVINVVMIPILDEQQKVTRIVRLNTDVTERTLAEKSRLEAAIQTERVNVLEELISTIAHDFKTPLTIIGTSLYLIGNVTNDETASKHIRRIEEQVSRLGDLINSLLTMSQLIGISDLSFRAQDINRIVYNVYSAKAPLAERKLISMSIEMAENLPYVLASDELTLAVSHLIDNAISFTPQGGTVSITTKFDDQKIVIEVTDSGVGIAEDEIQDIFEQFYRTDKARGTETGGAGMGLAIVRQIINLHHGDIQVSSKLGEGSTFRIILPALPQSLTATPPPE